MAWKMSGSFSCARVNEHAGQCMVSGLTRCSGCKRAPAVGSHAALRQRPPHPPRDQLQLPIPPCTQKGHQEEQGGRSQLPTSTGTPPLAHLLEADGLGVAAALNVEHAAVAGARKERGINRGGLSRHAGSNWFSPSAGRGSRQDAAQQRQSAARQCAAEHGGWDCVVKRS